LKDINNLLRLEIGGGAPSPDGSGIPGFLAWIERTAGNSSKK